MHLGRLTVVKEEKPEGRAHSMFSASGAERWIACPGSVKASEPMPDKDTPWSIEGTWAHGVLETMLINAISNGLDVISGAKFTNKEVNFDMVRHGMDAANFILGLHHSTAGSEIMVETRIYLDFIHKQMFGTFDGAVIDYFGTLHVFDYKYGAGHSVSPVKNLQMIFYGLGLAHKYHWNFKKIRLWIYQPRIKGFDGPLFWDISVEQLKACVPVFEKAVNRVLSHPDEFKEGSWCHWCKAKTVCPIKREAKIQNAIQAFTPITQRKEITSGKEKSSEEKELEAFYKKRERQKEKARKEDDEAGRYEF